MKKIIASILTLIICHLSFAQIQNTRHDQSNPMADDVIKYGDETFGSNVFVLDSRMDMKEIQALIDSLYQKHQPRTSEFGDHRFAFLLKQGRYKLDLKVAYYMNYIGLGELPGDVVVEGIIYSKGTENGNVTTNFWRSVENLTIQSPEGVVNIWGVSQAAPMRRMHIKGDIQLHDNGWASGGFIANSRIDGTVLAGGQQQWFTRNTELTKWEGGSWNIFFMGTANTPKDEWPDKPFTSLPTVPLVREKPFIVLGSSGYVLRKPTMKNESKGPDWTSGERPPITITDKTTKFDSQMVTDSAATGSPEVDSKVAEKVNTGIEPSYTDYPLDAFLIIKPHNATPSIINAALAKGQHVLFTPGIYELNESLKITRPGTVLMGLGMATLRSGNGNIVIEVDDVEGVSIAGLIIDAGEQTSETLVKVGPDGADISHKSNPTLLHDIFIRVGGYGEGKTKACLTINSHHVIVDHTWLWRADHGKNVGWDENVTRNGLIVNGDDVTIYGLFCEHFHEYQTLWNGNGGRMYFYQSEMPYDPPSSEAFMHEVETPEGKKMVNGYASYKVADHVKTHEAWALGIYCVFFKAPVIVDQAIEVPPHLEKNIQRKLTYWLYGGHKESIIKSIINGKGGHAGHDYVKRMMD